MLCKEISWILVKNRPSLEKVEQIRKLNSQETKENFLGHFKIHNS